MSQENVEIVRRGIEAMQREDVDAFMSLFDPEVELSFRSGVPEPGPFRGSEAVRRWIDGYLETWEQHGVDAEELVPFGEHVMAVLRFRARGAGSGVDLDWHDVHLYSFRRGRIIRWTTHDSRADALEAARLSGSAGDEG
jgi:ketosteroid isomerase-like protein